MTANEMGTTQHIQDILLKAGNAINGHDSEDSDMIYSSIAEWKASALYGNDACTSNNGANDISKSTNDAQCLRQQWYKTGYEYYQDEAKCPATVNGVLGGFAWLSQRDLEGSKHFLQHLQVIRPEFKVDKEHNGGVDTYALECGAGVYFVFHVDLSISEIMKAFLIIRFVVTDFHHASETFSPRNWKGIQRIALASRFFHM